MEELSQGVLLVCWFSFLAMTAIADSTNEGRIINNNKLTKNTVMYTVHPRGHSLDNDEGFVCLFVCLFVRSFCFCLFVFVFCFCFFLCVFLCVFFVFFLHDEQVVVRRSNVISDSQLTLP